MAEEEVVFPTPPLPPTKMNLRSVDVAAVRSESRDMLLYILVCLEVSSCRLRHHC
jgi:hypothetical protein